MTMNLELNHAKSALEAPPTQHAFVMLGTETLFLCHLTMFHMAEHRFQLVLRARLPDWAMNEFTRDRADHPDKTYFLGNVASDLWTVPEIAIGRRTTFKADVYRDIEHKRPRYEQWPWIGQTPLVRSVEVAIERVVYCRHFDFNLNFPQTLTYVVFGSGDEAHLTHYQVKEPDYDHVLSLATAPGWLPPAMLEMGVHLNFPALVQGARPPCRDPLAAGNHEVEFAGLQPRRRIVVAKTFWFATNVVNAVDPCGQTTS